MFRAIYSWIAEKFGVHVCREFTQWKKHKVICQRPLDDSDGLHYYTAAIDGTLHTKMVQFTRTFQERRCTLCGMVQQKPLEYFGEEDQVT